MILPILMEVKRQRPSIKCEIIFFDPKPYEDLTKSPFLFDGVMGVADTIDQVYKDSDGMKGDLSKVSKGFKLLPVIIRMLVSPRFVLLHTRSLDSPKMKLLYFINKLMSGYTYGHFSGLPLNIGRVPLESQRSHDEGDGFLCFGPHDRPFLVAKGKRKLFEIGYTRLYRVWIDRVRQVGQRYMMEEFTRLSMFKRGSIVGLFLPSTVPGVFEIRELEDWLDTTIKAVQKKIQDATIMIKPHPMQKMVHLEAFLRGRAAGSLAITHIHPAVLAANSKLVISHHSSTICDALAMRVPTIQYQVLTEHWMRRHPEGSAFLKLKPLWARSEKELDRCIDFALSDQYIAPNIGEILGHNEDISILLN